MAASDQRAHLEIPSRGERPQVAGLRLAASRISAGFDRSPGADLGGEPEPPGVAPSLTPLCAPRQQLVGERVRFYHTA